MVQAARALRTSTEAESWNGLEELRCDLRAFLSRRCSDENEREDIIHETYVRAVRYRAASKPTRLRAWLFSIARNVLLDRSRERERFSSLDAESESEWPEVHVEVSQELFQLGGWSLDRESAVLQLQGALASLRDEDRRVLSSYYSGGEDARLTARECAIPLHLVKTRLFRARRRLLKAMRRRLGLRCGRYSAGARSGELL